MSFSDVRGCPFCGFWSGFLFIHVRGCSLPVADVPVKFPVSDDAGQAERGAALVFLAYSLSSRAWWFGYDNAITVGCHGTLKTACVDRESYPIHVLARVSICKKSRGIFTVASDEWSHPALSALTPLGNHRYRWRIRFSNMILCAHTFKMSGIFAFANGLNN